jgi:EpsD family peptidyl-prolyl cis-trans isomerase
MHTIPRRIAPEIAWMKLERQLARPRLAACILAASGLLLMGLAGCNRSQGEKPATQVAAKVNKQELTVHQVNFLLEQQRGLRAERAEVARKQALERLIDQELAIQKAAEIKIDRDPQVMQQIEAARRDIIARTYYERLGNGASKPSESQVQKYYADNPALFSERRVYQLQEWYVEVPPEQVEAVRAKAQGTRLMAEFTDYLKAGNFKYEFNQATRAAEQLPLSSLASLSKLADGQTLVNNRPNGLQVIAVVSSRREPLELDRVRPAIEQFLLNEQKGRIVSDDLKALRQAAAIRYMPGFEGTAEAASAASGAAVPSDTGASAK